MPFRYSLEKTSREEEEEEEEDDEHVAPDGSCGVLAVMTMALMTIDKDLYGRLAAGSPERSLLRNNSQRCHVT